MPPPLPSRLEGRDEGIVYATQLSVVGSVEADTDDESALSVISPNYALKPMSCPAHIAIYQSHKRSYRENPMRLMEFGIRVELHDQDRTINKKIRELSKLIEQVAEQADMHSRRSRELINTAHTHDVKILQISQWLLDEQNNGGAGGNLYVDSLLNLLAVHLLRSYSAQFREARSPNCLTQQQIARALDYMRTHLDQDISLEVLAQTVNVSPSHLRRLFKQATGMAPHQYLIHLRVNRAKELLLTRGFSVNEVAAEVGFADQSHLHRHFKRIFGVTPKAVLAS